MRYFLTIFVMFLFVSCNKNETKPSEKIITKDNSNTKKSELKAEKKEDENITEIKTGNITLKFKNSRLVYPAAKTVLLFADTSKYSNAQEAVLKKLKTGFVKTKNPYLAKYFNITVYPTIVVIEGNKTVKYENFTPYEILKAEGF